MKKLVLIAIVMWTGCSNSDEEITNLTQDSSFENINYLTLTNENTNGGSQIACVKSGFTEDDVEFCFCNATCSREIITILELQYKKDSNDFRFKELPSDTYTTMSYRDWCTKVN